MSFDPRLAAGEGRFILLSGINYRDADISLRERFSVSDDGYEETLQRVLKLSAVDEAVLVSTCNRMELVIAPKDANAAAELPAVYETLSGVPRKEFDSRLYCLEDQQAVKHLFRVASGLDSMVLGEPQILGQLKSAFLRAEKIGGARSLLGRLFQRAFSVAKAVRTQTKIGERGVSVCYVARELAEQIFGELSGAVVLMVGAGEMGELSLKHFISAGVKRIFIANRTLERSIALADEFGAVPLTLSQIPEFLPQVDIVVGSAALGAGAPYLIDDTAVHRSLAVRRGNPQFFIDLGVPRNFHPTIGGESDAFLYNIDDLQEVARANLNLRELEVDRAELIVDEEVERFWKWLRQRRVEPQIREVLESWRQHGHAEVEKTLRRLRREQSLSPENEAVIESALRDMADSVVQKLLHRPLSIIKDEEQDPDCARWFRRLLLNDEE